MRNRGLALLIALLGLSIFAGAVTPQFWENFAQEELLGGSLNRVSLGPDGKLFPAPAYDLVYDTGQSYLFSAVRDKLGNLYVGTGDEGKVFKIDPQGKGSLYFQAKELNIFAMAMDASDTLYVGTSPDGKIYKVSGPEKSEEFCDLESKYIWAMVFDDAGNLYAGTGANGIIYKVDKSGSKSVFYTCSDSHVRCLLRNNKNLLAGTSPGGLVIEITPERKGFALMDSPLEEVHALAVDRFGTIYAVAASSKGSAATTQTKPAAAATETSVTTAVVTAVTSVVALAEKGAEIKIAGTAEEKGTVSAKSTVYAITRDGSVETVYESDEQLAYDAVMRGDGSLLLATGPKGRLLEVAPSRRITILSDSPEEDSTRLLDAGDAVYIGTSNQGKVYKLKPQLAPSGIYESKALDAKVISSWGKISWHAEGLGDSTVEVSTRTGNTEKPNSSWSDWSSPYKAPGQQISSPRARYLQWRVAFKSDLGTSGKKANGGLERVQIAYLQQNMRPQVTELEALPFGIELQKQPSLAMSGLGLLSPSATVDGRSLNAPRERGREQQPLPPRQALQPGTQSFTWKATDENEDSLDFSLYFRGEAESDWKLLEKRLTDTFYTLNTASLPDGRYQLKVVANDAPSNPYDKSLIGERISSPFVVANATPTVEITGSAVSGKKVAAQFYTTVRTGCIATAEFSVDGGDWLLVYPDDGIADSAKEEYRIVTPDLSPGEHLIGFRASDRNGMTGTAKLIVRIP